MNVGRSKQCQVFSIMIKEYCNICYRSTLCCPHILQQVSVWECFAGLMTNTKSCNRKACHKPQGMFDPQGIVVITLEWQRMLNFKMYPAEFSPQQLAQIYLTNMRLWDFLGTMVRTWSWFEGTAMHYVQHWHVSHPL